MTSVSIEPELRLKRYIYFTSEESRYIVSIKNFHCCELSKIPSLFELISANKESLILDVIDSAKNDSLCTKRETLIFVLAAFTRNAQTKETKTLAYDRVLEVCKTAGELYLFIKFAHILNSNFSHGLRRVIEKFYLQKTPLEFLQIVTECNGYYGFTHQDVFKLIHIKVQENPAQEVVLHYAMKGLKFVKKKIEEMDEDKKKADDFKEIYSKLEKHDKLKHCQSDKEAVDLIKENNFKISQIPTELLKHEIVWECLIPTLKIQELLPHLVRLNRLGFLKSNNLNSALNQVVEIISDKKKCLASKIQPVEALVHLKTFERGKPIDPQKKAYIVGVAKANDDEPNNDAKKKEIMYLNPPKNKVIISALYKLLNNSFKNVQSTGRRFLITVDGRENYMKKFCFANKTLTCKEAAACLAFSFVKAEKEVTVAIFNGDNLILVPIDKSMTYIQVLQKLKSSETCDVVLETTVNWAIKNSKSVDVFLHIIYSADAFRRVSKEFRNQESGIIYLKKYRQKMHLPNTKMIIVSLGGPKLQVADGSPHILDICGFDNHVPKLIDICCKGVLQ